MGKVMEALPALPTLYTVHQAAEKTQLSVHTVRGHLSRGVLPRHKIGQRVFIEHGDLFRLMNGELNEKAHQLARPKKKSKKAKGKVN